MAQGIVGFEFDQSICGIDGLVEGALLTKCHRESVPGYRQFGIYIEGAAVAGDGFVDTAVHEMGETLSIQFAAVAHLFDGFFGAPQEDVNLPSGLEIAVLLGQADGTSKDLGCFDTVAGFE